MHCGRCQIISVVIKAFSFLLCNYGQVISLGCTSVPSWPIAFLVSLWKKNCLSYHLFYTPENWGILGDSEILCLLHWQADLLFYLWCCYDYLYHSSQSRHSSWSFLQYLSKPPWCIPILWPFPSVPDLSSHANSLVVRLKLLLLLIPKLIQQHFLKRKHKGFFSSWCFITC